MSKRNFVADVRIKIAQAILPKPVAMMVGHEDHFDLLTSKIKNEDLVNLFLSVVGDRVKQDWSLHSPHCDLSSAKCPHKATLNVVIEGLENMMRKSEELQKLWPPLPATIAMIENTHPFVPRAKRA